MKGSNESTSFSSPPVFSYSIIHRPCKFCFISPLHMPHSPPVFFFFSFFLFRTVHLASLPLLSPRRVPPALLRSAAFVTSAVRICCLSLALPCSCSRPFASGSREPARAENNQKTIPPWPLLAPLRSMQGTRCCSLSTADWWRSEAGSAAA